MLICLRQMYSGRRTQDRRYTLFSMGFYILYLLFAPCVYGSEETSSAQQPIIKTLKEIGEAFASKGVPPPGNEMTDSLVDHFIKAYDPQGRFVTGQEYQDLEEVRDGYFFSVGIELDQTNGDFRIKNILPDGTTNGAGFNVQDELIQIDGRSLEGKTPWEAAAFLKGTNTTARLIVRDDAGETNRVEMARRRVQWPSIAWIETWPFDLCYIRLNGLYADAGETVPAAMKAWQDAEKYGVVLDLRGAGGDDLKSTIEIAGLYVEKEEPLFIYKDCNDQRLEAYRSQTSENLTMPLMVLIDSDTVAAAELLAAVFAGSAHGVIVMGQASRADMLIRELVPLLGGQTCM